MDGMGAAEKNKRFILVVDANVDDRFHTSMLLQRFGYNIGSAHVAEEAIEFMCIAPPVAVVAEAGPTGSSLLLRLKKDHRFSDIPLILLRKPVDAEELYRAVQSNVEKTPRRNIRIATSLKAKLEDGLGGSDEYVSVLSEHGMFFRTLDPRPVNARIPASLEIKGRTIKIEAVVLYSYSFDEGPFKEPGMGMKFVKISPDDSALIKAFILEQIEAGIARQGP